MYLNHGEFSWRVFTCVKSWDSIRWNGLVFNASWRKKWYCDLFSKNSALFFRSEKFNWVCVVLNLECETISSSNVKKATYRQSYLFKLRRQYLGSNQGWFSMNELLYHWVILSTLEEAVGNELNIHN